MPKERTEKERQKKGLVQILWSAGVGRKLGSCKDLVRVHVFIHLPIHSTFIKLYARYRIGEEVGDLRGRRVERGSLGGSR